MLCCPLTKIDKLFLLLDIDAQTDRWTDIASYISRGGSKGGRKRKEEEKERGKKKKRPSRRRRMDGQMDRWTDGLMDVAF